MLSDDQLRAALSRAYHLGQTYWRQADSESYKQHRLADETQAKFDALVEETILAMYPAPESTAPASIGFQIEAWVCYGMPDAPLTPAQRSEIREYAEGFEECGASHDDLVDMADHALICAAYQAMAEYARGQM